jgi:transposase
MARRRKRPNGHPGSYRVILTHVDDHVDVPLAACPGCVVVSQVEEVEQFIEEIPPIRPRVTRLATYRGHCSG